MLAHVLCRSIVLQEPARVVHPPSWLEHVPFAFWIVDALRPSVFVELGTQSGNSYASFAQAVQMLELSCACYAVDTWRGDSQSGFYDEDVFTEWSAYHQRHFSAFSSLIRSTFSDAAHHFRDGSIDLLHRDSCRTYESACADLELWRPKLSRRGVILLHDINVRGGDSGVWRLWEELKGQSPTFEFLHGHGLGVLAAGSDIPEPLKWLFSLPPFEDETNIVRQFFARLGGGISSRFVAAESVERGRNATISRLTNERKEESTPSPDHLITVTTDLKVETARRAHDTLRISEVEELNRPRRELQDELGRKGPLVAALRERLKSESERRRQAEAERDELMLAARVDSRATHQGPIRNLYTACRHGARKLRTIAMTPVAMGLVPGRGRHPVGPLRAMLRDPAKLRDAYLVLACGLFDADYYLHRYPDVARSRLAPLAHFVIRGAYEGRSPHPLFDTNYYLRCNPDVASRGLNPLVHYKRQGAFEGRSPHPLFDPTYCLANNPDVRNARIEPLAHFCRSGGLEGRNPNPFFDTTYYFLTNPDVADRRANPLLHFHLHGWREGRRPSPGFDPLFYLSQNEDVRLQGGDPLVHYLEHGRIEGRAAVAPSAVRAMGDQELAEPREVTLRVNRLEGGAL